MSSPTIQTPDDRPRERPARPVHSAVVSRTEWLSPGMVRIFFTGPDLVELPELTLTDHYLKMIFAPAGVDYRWPFDVDLIKEGRPPEQWPVTRTYTIRSFDRERNEMAIDFVVHGTEGLAGPWAAAAQPGDALGFRGPGGGYVPDPGAPAQLLVGDEAAIPAIAAALEHIPAGVPTVVLLEVDGPEAEFELTHSAETRLHWVHRGQRPYGEALSEAVRAVDLPVRVQAFVHGNAEMVKQLRPYLLRERGLDRDQVSISGYWRTGHTEDRWQATKREFNQAMDAELTS